MSKYPLAFGRVSVHDLVGDGQKQYIIQKKDVIKNTLSARGEVI